MPSFRLGPAGVAGVLLILGSTLTEGKPRLSIPAVNRRTARAYRLRVALWQAPVYPSAMNAQSQDTNTTPHVVPGNVVERVIKWCDGVAGHGGQAFLARECGVTTAAVGRWKRTGVVPPTRVLAVVRAVRWVFSPHELRPDLYPAGMNWKADAARADGVQAPAP